MGEVTISVAGRAYQVVCEDGEEDRLTAIAARVDREAQAFGGATPSLSEPRLLLMCALLLADKLDEVESAPQAAPPAMATAGAEVDMAFVDEATARIEALATPNDEPAPEAAAQPGEQPGEQPERRSKSSAAVAAEKDLLSWAERTDPREEDEADLADDVSADPAPPTEETAQDEPPAESEEEAAARERADRRKRRRERLARLASQDEGDQ